jgi:hypothetical protein
MGGLIITLMELNITLVKINMGLVILNDERVFMTFGYFL